MMLTTWTRNLMAWLPVIVIVVCPGCDGVFGRVRGSGVVKTEQREIGAFSRIRVSGCVKLAWQPAKEAGVEVTVEDNLLPHLVTEVVGDTLKIHFTVNVDPTQDVVVKAAGPDLDGLTGSGATQITLAGVRSENFELQLSGASECTAAGQVKELTVHCSGASTCNCADLDADAAAVTTSGAATADVRAKGLKSIHQSGASKVSVSQVRADDLKIELSGASKCTLLGQAKELDIHTSGASAVLGAGLKAKTVHVSLSGASHVEVEAMESITGSVSGSARVRCHGSADTQSIRTSGAASVRSD